MKYNEQGTVEVFSTPHHKRSLESDGCIRVEARNGIVIFPYFDALVDVQTGSRELSDPLGSFLACFLLNTAA